jgi:tRNA 2-selenouridine synthase
VSISKLTIEDFLSLAKEHPVLDVRSPGEFKQAHIPGATSLPLFSDEERKVVGTAYKQESQQKAIKLGLEYFGGKMVTMVEEVEEICKAQSTKHEVRTEHSPVSRISNIVLVHCWRGGMRSAGVAWLLDLYGFKVYTLIGGYKVYRKWVLQQFEKNYPINILGGYTGSGKTEVLQALAKKSAAVIDLEKLASHKGSTFGGLGMPLQPSQEMFENLLATELKMIEERWQADNTKYNVAGKHHPSSAIWLEDESQRIGEVNIPTVFFQQMRTKKIFFVSIPFEARLDFIVQQYGKFEKEKLVNSIIRIKKRLGGLETKTAINHLIEDNIKDCFAVLLNYYDKYYLKGLQNRENFASLYTKVESITVDDEKNAAQLLDLVTQEKVI